jgi:hypothetical protein
MDTSSDPRRILVLGTTHEVQERDYSGTHEFEHVLRYMSSEWRVQVIMEEWKSNGAATVGQRFSNEFGLGWYNVGTRSRTRSAPTPI